MPEPEAAEVRAAGGVVWRDAGGGSVEVAVVHRPRYDDWSLPKGKLDPDETWQEAALREVLEETGARCELGPELPPVAYRDHKGRSKVVRYWLMRAWRFEAPTGDEVDDVAWLRPEQAVDRLTYERDRDLLRQASL